MNGYYNNEKSGGPAAQPSPVTAHQRAVFRAGPVPGHVIASWPVKEAGLPARITNRAPEHGCHTVGEILAISDAELTRWRSVGKVSLRKRHEYIRLCNALENGVLTFSGFHEILMTFLDEDELDVIATRFRLTTRDMDSPRRLTTLQAIGDPRNKTRERIRQVEEAALSKLSSRLGRACLEPVYRYFKARLHELNRTSTCRQLAAACDQSLFDNYNPCNVLFLLAALSPRDVTYFNGVFSLLSPATLSQLTSQIRAALHAVPHPCSVEETIAAMTEPAPLKSPEELAAAVGALLHYISGVAALTDGRFVHEANMASIVAEILTTAGTPQHFRKITAALNERLVPGSRKGAGFVLDILNSDDRFSRVERGIYTLR